MGVVEQIACIGTSESNKVSVMIIFFVLRVIF